jgi:hypothetical protein
VSPRESFVFGNGVSLAIDGPRRALDHFTAEYGPNRQAIEFHDADVQVHIERPPYEELREIGGYKTARWRIAMGSAHEERLTVSIALLSVPASFGLSLVQGYFVEPILEMAFTRRGQLLAPAAGYVIGDSACLLVGASRSGKSSLMVRALGEGIRILGDDQVIISSRATVLSFPRRLRVYADIRNTAFHAYRAFPVRLKIALRGLEALSRSTAGWVTPPVRIQASALGPQPATLELPLRRLYVIDRDEQAVGPRRSAVEAGRLVDEILTLLDRQRERLIPLLVDRPWADLLQRVRSEESVILKQALAEVSAERLVVPSHWKARRAIDHLQHEIGLAR